MSKYVEQGERYQALKQVYKIACEEIHAEREALRMRPLPGWETERHQEYHAQALLAAEAAERWLFLHLMRIDPD